MNIEKKDGFITIPSLNFFGRYESSPDRSYDVAFESSGRFVLLNEGDPLLSGKVGAQIEACVANTGTFLLRAVTSLENLRSEAEAMRSYKAAPSLDPKVGAKKRFDVLRKTVR